MLEVRHISRSFKDVRALDDICFTAPQGAMVGFVGGNGAGKTTTMRIIMGVLSPDSGDVLWDGAAITPQIRRSIGYMPEERGLYAKQPIDDQLVYMAMLKGMSRQAAHAQVTQILEEFGLGDRMKDKLEKLSLGNQQRVQIAAALVSDPIALVLDEPFSGLDPAAVDSMASMLGALTQRGCPVLFSSHQLDLVERLCDKLVILSSGKVVADGTAEQLQATDIPQYQLRCDEGDDLAWLDDIAGVQVLQRDLGYAKLTVPPGLENEVVAQAISRGHLKEFGIVRRPLSEIYREVTA